MNDREVHARHGGAEVVRYNHAGKWYLELAADYGRMGLPSERRQRPAARRTDPSTSHTAAHNTRATAHTNRAIALDTLRRFHRGLTDFELAEVTGIQQTSIGKRRGELRDAGLVRDSGTRRPSPTGSPSIVWEAM